MFLWCVNPATINDLSSLSIFKIWPSQAGCVGVGSRGEIPRTLSDGDALRGPRKPYPMRTHQFLDHPKGSTHTYFSAFKLKKTHDWLHVYKLHFRSLIQRVKLILLYTAVKGCSFHVTIQTWRTRLSKLLQFWSMAEDDGLLLNFFSHSDGNEEVIQGRRDRKLKVKYSILNKY